MVNTITKNHWRIEPAVTKEDAYQEGFALFAELRARYKGKVTNAAWFMSLFMRSYTNRITDMANDATELRRCIYFSDLSRPDEHMEESWEERLVGEVENAGGLQLFIEQAPAEVRQVFTVLLNSPREILSAAATSWKRRGKRKENGNQFLCALLGYDHKEIDVEGLVRDYVKEAV